MVKRIQQVIIFILLASLLFCGNVFAQDTSDYTSPYYSDTSSLEEAELIDRLYEYGFMGGVITPTETKRGRFGPNNVVTNQEFDMIIGNILQIEEYEGQPYIMTHKQAITQFRKYLLINSYPPILQEYILPNADDEYFTRLDLAKLVYSFIEDIYFPKNSGQEIVDYAMNYLGYSYARGGNGPTYFDCSGFTQYIYKQFGYTISRTCNGQNKEGKYISLNDLLPGDIVLFERTYYASGCTHAGIYIGNNLFIHAANRRKGVIISSLDETYYASRFVCGRRIWE